MDDPLQCRLAQSSACVGGWSWLAGWIGDRRAQRGRQGEGPPYSVGRQALHEDPNAPPISYLLVYPHERKSNEKFRFTLCRYLSYYQCSTETDFLPKHRKPKLAISKNRNSAETEYSAKIVLFLPKQTCFCQNIAVSAEISMFLPKQLYFDRNRKYPQLFI